MLFHKTFISKAENNFRLSRDSSSFSAFKHCSKVVWIKHNSSAFWEYCFLGLTISLGRKFRSFENFLGGRSDKNVQSLYGFLEGGKILMWKFVINLNVEAVLLEWNFMKILLSSRNHESSFKLLKSTLDAIFQSSVSLFCPNSQF